MRKNGWKKSIFVLLGFALFVACAKDEPIEENIDPESGESSSGILGYSKWENSREWFKVQFQIIDDAIVGYDLPLMSERLIETAFENDRVNTITIDDSGEKTLYTIIYQDSTILKIENNSNAVAYEFELDTSGRIEQINQSNGIFYELVYSVNDIKSIVKTQGFLKTTYQLLYDNTLNPFYKVKNLDAFTICREFFGVAPNNWTFMDFLLTLTEHNISQISYDNKTIDNTYYHTDARIDSVIQTWSVLPDKVIVFTIDY